eukprot:5740892-Alexandrium_andersonii.AAC.1
MHAALSPQAAPRRAEMARSSSGGGSPPSASRSSAGDSSPAASPPAVRGLTGEESSSVESRTPPNSP